MNEKPPVALLEIAIKSVKYERDIAAARVAELDELLKKLADELNKTREAANDGK